MANILGVGVATLDIINHVESFPEEDMEVRATRQEVRRGGNATNTLVVLSQLGHACSWAGTLADDDASALIRQELDSYAMDQSVVQQVSGGRVPTSYITLNQQNGSRTIVHYRDLAEFQAVDFCRLDLAKFDWLHFEGRNVEETLLMLEFAGEHYPHTPCSLEVEKPRENIEALFSLADILLYSRPYAEARGFSDATQFLVRMRMELPRQVHVCTWGEAGAYAVDSQRHDEEAMVIHCPAVIPPVVMDTLGAGDTFNAGFIHASLRDLSLADRVREACELAGRKCGQAGLKGLL